VDWWANCAAGSPALIVLALTGEEVLGGGHLACHLSAAALLELVPGGQGVLMELARWWCWMAPAPTAGAWSWLSRAGAEGLAGMESEGSMVRAPWGGAAAAPRCALGLWWTCSTCRSSLANECLLLRTVVLVVGCCGTAGLGGSAGRFSCGAACAATCSGAVAAAALRAAR
jgi:hypothetical protein